MKTEYGITIDLPVVPFIVVVGFMLILIIEQTVLHFQVGRIYSVLSSLKVETDFIGGET